MCLWGGRVDEKNYTVLIYYFVHEIIDMLNIYHVISRKITFTCTQNTKWSKEALKVNRKDKKTY